MVLVFLGSGLGGVCRFLLNSYIQRFNLPFYMGIMLINLLASLLVGYMACKYCISHDAIRKIVIVGFLSGFSTFSSFSMYNLQLIQQNAWNQAIINIVLSVLGGLACTLLGWKIATL